VSTLAAVKPRSLLLPTLAAIVVAALALGLRQGVATAGPKSEVASGKVARISIRDFAFGPQTLTVHVGTRISVTNFDTTEHTLTSNTNAFDTGTLAPGHATASFVVNKPGTYAYQCQFHAFMTGTIHVIG